MLHADKVLDAAAVGFIFPTSLANLTPGSVATTASYHCLRNLKIFLRVSEKTEQYNVLTTTIQLYVV
jgi:hypothetical protein